MRKANRKKKSLGVLVVKFFDRGVLSFSFSIPFPNNPKEPKHSWVDSRAVGGRGTTRTHNT